VPPQQRGHFGRITPGEIHKNGACGIGGAVLSHDNFVQSLRLEPKRYQGPVQMNGS
jgi:hypothetical protein